MWSGSSWPITFSQTKHVHEIVLLEPSQKMTAHHRANFIDQKVRK